jgi:hypothetical protein
MFDYRPAMKVKIIKKKLYHGYLLEQCIETLGFFYNFFFGLFPFIREYLTEKNFEQKVCQIAKICHTKKKHL